MDLSRRILRISTPLECLEHSEILVTQTLMGNTDLDVPVSYEQEISSNERDNWKQAMQMN